MTKLTIGGVDYVPAGALSKAFADGMLAGNDFGREITRREIRRAQAKALLAMRRVAPSYGDYIHAADIHEYMKSIDAATKPWKPRKREQVKR